MNDVIASDVVDEIIAYATIEEVVAVAAFEFVVAAIAPNGVIISVTSFEFVSKFSTTNNNGIAEEVIIAEKLDGAIIENGD